METKIFFILAFASLLGAIFAFSGGTGDAGDVMKSTSPNKVEAKEMLENKFDGGMEKEGKSDDTKEKVGEEIGYIKNSGKGKIGYIKDTGKEKEKIEKNAGRGKGKIAAKRMNTDKLEKLEELGKLGKLKKLKRIREMVEKAEELAKKKGKEGRLFKIGAEFAKEVKEDLLECTGEETVRERIKCRLKIVKEKKDDALKYLPEECRRLDDEGRKECLRKYYAMEKCAKEGKSDKEKFACVREMLNATKSARELVRECKEKAKGNGTDASEGIGECVSKVRSKVYERAKFRLHNLEKKAEKLTKYGVSEETIEEFITAVEGLKLEFEDAQGAEGKKAVLKQAVDIWKEFVQQAKEEARAFRASSQG